MLRQEAIDEISFQYDAAMSNDHGSGDHWILMSVLDKYDFRTNSPTLAMKVAEEILTCWFNLQK